MSLGSSGFRLRSRLAAGWTSGFSLGASKPPANARPPSFPKSTTSSLNRGAPPTRLTSVLLLSLRDLRSMTNLALRATKATTQAIGLSMSSLVVLERHLWLTLTEMKEADKVPFLDAPVSSNSLFGPAVEGFAERFTEAQKSSQAMRHFLPKRASSAASSRPKPAPTQQPAKPKPATPEPLPPKGRQDRGRSRSARR